MQEKRRQGSRWIEDLCRAAAGLAELTECCTFVRIDQIRPDPNVPCYPLDEILSIAHDVTLSRAQ
ncbi:619_t:CDS:2 [Acaulospora colombiana]|uniref:619_t:CDS:1 n=1 Tax=Acaulospora colombiana TaxID=27376 RepID=A0ACA9MWF1_9GLOM|nr:619_t:CDS:2 [Acaulospora colombiana]